MKHECIKNRKTTFVKGRLEERETVCFKRTGSKALFSFMGKNSAM